MARAPIYPQSRPQGTGDLLALVGGWARNMANASDPDGGNGRNGIADATAMIAQRQALQRKQSLQDKIAALISGDDGEEVADETVSTPGTRRMGPSVDEVAVEVPATGPALPAVKRRSDPDRLAKALTAATYAGDADAAKTAEVFAKLRPDLDKGLYTDSQGRVHVRDGYADASRSLSQASTAGSEAAKADLDVMDVALEDGSSVQMPRGVFIQLQKTGQFPQLGKTQTPGAKVTQEQSARAPFEMVTVKMPDGSEEQMTLDEFRAARGGGGATPRSVPTNGAGRSQTPADKVYTEGQAKGALERYQGIQSQGSAAPGKIANLQQIGSLLDGVEGGKLSPLGLDIAQAANSLGFRIDKNLGNKEAANALSQQIALSFKDQLPGPLSNADRNFLVQMAPGLAQSAQGRKLMIQSATKVYQRNADVAAKARAWQQRFGRIDTPDASGKTFDDYLSAWAEKNPLFQPKAK